MSRPGNGMHRLLPALNLPSAGRPFRVAASPEERREIAQRFDLLAVDSLTAEGALFPEADGQRVKLQGRLIADVVQTCVVSLDAVPAHIDVPFERLFGWDAGGEPTDDADDELLLDLDDDPPVERLTADTIDVGEATAEQLALELDPYPRKPGALFTGCDIGGGETADPAAGSLAGLGRRWKRGGSDGNG